MDLVRDGKTYFTVDELKCKGSGEFKLAEGFAEKLLDLRIAFDLPMLPISCCRSAEHNKKVGGADSSHHILEGIGTHAIDIHCPDPLYRTALAKLALATGWTVGVKRTMLHLDRRTDYNQKDPQLLFVYGV